MTRADQPIRITMHPVVSGEEVESAEFVWPRDADTLSHPWAERGYDSIGVPESGSISMPGTQRRRNLIEHDDLSETITVQVCQRNLSIALDLILENAGAFFVFELSGRQRVRRSLRNPALLFREGVAERLTIPRPREDVPVLVGKDHFHFVVAVHITQRRRGDGLAADLLGPARQWFAGQVVSEHRAVERVVPPADREDFQMAVAVDITHAAGKSPSHRLAAPVGNDGW